MARRLSNGKLYNIFLFKQTQLEITSSEDTLYLITLRDISNINEIYDL